FDERLGSLETTFSEYRQTNPFVDVVSAIPANLSEMELKKILIEKIEGNKSIQCEDERMMIRKGPPLDQTGGLKDKKKEVSMHQLAFHLKQQPGVQADLPQGLNLDNCLPPRRPPSSDRDWNKTLPAAQGDAQSWISDLARQTDARSSFNELLDTPIDFSNFIMNWLNVNTLTPELLAGRRVIPFDHFVNNDLEYLRGGASSRKYTTSVTKTKAEDYGHIKWIEDLVPRAMWIQQLIDYNRHALWGVSHWGRKRQQFYRYAVNWESALDVYSKRRIIAVTELKIVEWYDYKHLDWISVRRDDDIFTNLKKAISKGYASKTLKICCYSWSIVIKRRVEDLQLGVESYQKKLNLTKLDTYRTDLRLMRIDELHKFSDGTLNDVRNALDDRLKGIRMQYLPSTIWRKGAKDRAAAMIQAIEKILKTRRIMRSLEKFVGGLLQSYNVKPKSDLENPLKITTGLAKEKTLEFKTKKPEESPLNWKPLHKDWAATTSKPNKVQAYNSKNTKCRYNRKGFLEDDDSSDDSIFIVDPGWDDYCLQELKLNRPVPCCLDARRPAADTKQLEQKEGYLEETITILSGVDPERHLELSRERRANLVPAETNLPLCNQQSYQSLRTSGLQHIHLGIFMIRLHALHRRSAGTNALVVLRDTRWEDSQQIIETMEKSLYRLMDMMHGKEVKVALKCCLPNTPLELDDKHNRSHNDDVHEKKRAPKRAYIVQFLSIQHIE
nr:hypothetical protein [Tanacetum cinerariifolium]